VTDNIPLYSIAWLTLSPLSPVTTSPQHPYRENKIATSHMRCREKGGDSGDSGDSGDTVDFKGEFLSPPSTEVVTGGDRRTSSSENVSHAPGRHRSWRHPRFLDLLCACWATGASETPERRSRPRLLCRVEPHAPPVPRPRGRQDHTFPVSHVTMCASAASAEAGRCCAASSVLKELLGQVPHPACRDHDLGAVPKQTGTDPVHVCERSSSSDAGVAIRISGTAERVEQCPAIEPKRVRGRIQRPEFLAG